MSAIARRRAFVVFALTVLVLLVAAYVTYRYAVRYPDRPAQQPGREVVLEIPRGTPFPQLLLQLERVGLLKSPVAFRIFANYKGVASKVRAGHYRLNTAITPRKLLDILVHGVPAPTVKVTIPEGKNKKEIAALLASVKIAPAKGLLAAMRNPKFLRRIGVPAADMEGFLFPDTYRFKTHSPPEQVLEVLFRRHRGVFVGIRQRHGASLVWLREKLGWGQREIVTMASIVEKETGQSHERPLIAGVFLNRLTSPRFNPKLLQTDPTIIYGCTVPPIRSPACQRFQGRIRRAQLDDGENPYNTYAHPGLPPGPIANPGAKAIEAVFAPQRKAGYLYFVSRNDGTHHFSRTRAEHERAVDRYQRNKKTSAASAPKEGSARGARL